MVLQLLGHARKLNVGIFHRKPTANLLGRQITFAHINCIKASKAIKEDMKEHRVLRDCTGINGRQINMAKIVLLVSNYHATPSPRDICEEKQKTDVRVP